MKNPFCQNILCPLHREAPEGATEAVYSPSISLKSEEIKIRRLKVVCAGKEFDFCQICANVLAMVHGVKPNVEKQNNEISKEIRKTESKDEALAEWEFPAGG